MSQLSSAHALGRAHHAAYVPPGASAAAANPAVGRASAGPWTPRRAASPAHALAPTSRSGLYEPPSVRAANAGYAPSSSSLSAGPAATTQAAPGVFSKERLLRIRESAPPGPNLLDDPTGEHALVVADAPLAPLAVLPMTEAEHQALATGNIHPEGVGKKPDTSTSQTRLGAARAVPSRPGQLTAAPTNPAALRGRRIDRPASISSAPGYGSGGGFDSTVASPSDAKFPASTGAGIAPGSRPGSLFGDRDPGVTGGGGSVAPDAWGASTVAADAGGWAARRSRSRSPLRGAAPGGTNLSGMPGGGMYGAAAGAGAGDPGALAGLYGGGPAAVDDWVLHEWFYRDPQGNEQGPFEPDRMQEWYQNKYFAGDLLVKAVFKAARTGATHDSGPYTPLDRLIATACRGDTETPFLSARLLNAPGGPGGPGGAYGAKQAQQGPYDMLGHHKPGGSPATAAGYYGGGGAIPTTGAGDLGGASAVASAAPDQPAVYDPFGGVHMGMGLGGMGGAGGLNALGAGAGAGMGAMNPLAMSMMGYGALGAPGAATGGAPDWNMYAGAMGGWGGAAAANPALYNPAWAAAAAAAAAGYPYGQSPAAYNPQFLQQLAQLQASAAAAAAAAAANPLAHGMQGLNLHDPAAAAWAAAQAPAAETPKEPTPAPAAAVQQPEQRQQQEVQQPTQEVVPEPAPEPEPRATTPAKPASPVKPASPARKPASPAKQSPLAEEPAAQVVDTWESYAAADEPAAAATKSPEAVAAPKPASPIAEVVANVTLPLTTHETPVEETQLKKKTTAAATTKKATATSSSRKTAAVAATPAPAADAAKPAAPTAAPRAPSPARVEDFEQPSLSAWGVQDNVESWAVTSAATAWDTVPSLPSAASNTSAASSPAPPKPRNVATVAAPWSAVATKTETAPKPKLADIMQQEQKRTKRSSANTGAATPTGSAAPVVTGSPSTTLLSWGTPTTAMGKNTADTANAAAAAAATAAAAPWKAPSSGTKSFAQIQREEEERARKRAAEQAAAAAELAAVMGMTTSAASAPVSTSVLAAAAAAAGSSPVPPKSASASPAPSTGASKVWAAPAVNAVPVSVAQAAAAAAASPALRRSGSNASVTSNASAASSVPGAVFLQGAKATRGSKPAAPSPVGSSDWVKVGAPKPAKTATVTPAAASPAPKPQPRIVAVPAAPAKRGLSDEISKWARQALNKLPSAAQLVPELLTMMADFRVDDANAAATADTIATLILEMSTSVDGRAFAAEFVRRRRVEQGLAASWSAANASSGSGSGSGSSRAQSGAGFVTVGKKKKAGKR